MHEIYFSDQVNIVCCALTWRTKSQQYWWVFKSLWHHDTTQQSWLLNIQKKVNSLESVFLLNYLEESGIDFPHQVFSSGQLLTLDNPRWMYVGEFLVNWPRLVNTGKLRQPMATFGSWFLTSSNCHRTHCGWRQQAGGAGPLQSR